MSHSNCTWKINLEQCSIGDERVGILVRGAVEEETHCTGGISDMNLRDNVITAEGVKLSIAFSKTVNQQIGNTQSA